MMAKAPAKTAKKNAMKPRKPLKPDADGVVRRVHYDLFYVEHRSTVLDLRTLFRTLAVVVRRPRPVSAPV